MNNIQQMPIDWHLVATIALGRAIAARECLRAGNTDEAQSELDAAWKLFHEISNPRFVITEIMP